MTKTRRPWIPSVLFMALLPACPDDPVPADEGSGTRTTGAATSTGAAAESTSGSEAPATMGGTSSESGTTTRGSTSNPTAEGPADSTGTTSAQSTTSSSSGGSTDSTDTGGSSSTGTSTDDGGTSSESSSGGPGCALPDALPGLVLWLRADMVVEDGMGVLTWIDQSPTSNDATRTMGSPGAPQRLMGGFNGQDAVGFGGDTVLALDSDLALGDFTIFVVGVSTKPDEGFHMIMGPGPLNQQIRYDGSNDILLVGPGNGGPVSVYSPGDNKVPHYFTIDGLAGNWSLYWNGSFVSTEVAAVGQWQLGSVGAWFGQHYLVGDLAEIIVYDDSLGMVDRDEVHCYLSDRYLLP